MTSPFLKRTHRQLSRMRYRAAGSGLLIFIAVAAYVSLGAMVPTAQGSLDDTVERLGLSHYLVHTAAGDEGDLPSLSRIDGVSAVEGRLTVSSRMSVGPSGQATVSATLLGIDPDALPAINSIDITEGSFFPNRGEGEVILEKGVASKEGIGVGDRVSILTDGGWAELTVVGLALSPEYIFLPTNPQSIVPVPGSQGVAFLSIDLLREVFGLGPGALNEFLFMLDDPADTAAQGAALKALGDRTVIYSMTKDEVPGYAIIKADLVQGESFSFIIALLILVVAFFVIYASFTRLVQEQRREIGVLRAIGYRRRSLMASYLYTSVLIGGTASVLAVLAAIPLSGAFSDFYVQEALHIPASAGSFPLGVVAGALLFGPLTAGLASGLATWRTVRMGPQEALRGAMVRGYVRRRGSRRTFRGPYLMLYSWRNIVRQRGRTVILVVAVTFSVVMGSMSLLMMASFSNSFAASVEEGEHWDLVVDFAIPLNETAVDQMLVPGIDTAVPVAKVLGRWQSLGSSGVGTVIGMDPQQDLHRSGIYKGRAVQGDGEALVSFGLYDRSGINVGDHLVLSTPHGSKGLTVVGVTEDAIGDLFVSTGTVRELGGQDVVLGMFLRTADGRAEEARTALLSSPLVANVLPRDSMRSGLVDLMGSYQGILYMFELVTVTISALAITNLVFVSVLERRNEYGQLMALGYSQRDIARSVTAEVLAVMSIGAVLALPMTLGILESYVEEFKAFWPQYRTVLYPSDWLGYLAVVGVTVVLGLLAILPALRELRKMDVDKAVTGGRFG